MCLAKQVCRLTEFHKSYSSASVIATFLVREMDLSGIIAAIPTPFRGDQQQSVDYENLKQNLFKWEKIPLKGYLISGSLGERPFLTNEEKLDIIKTVRSTVDPSKLIIAGTTCESTEHTYQLSEAAAKAGADAVLIMAPHYYKSLITDKLIIEHFTKLADLLPIPIIIYNNPMTTSIDISLNAIELLANHPNICGIKDVTVAKLGCIVERTRGKNFQALAASVGYLLPSLLMGCVGSMNGLSSVLGEAVCELYALSKAHEWDKAMEIQRRLILPDLVCSRELGCNGLKAAMEMLGYYGGLSRKPLLPLNDEQKSRIRNTLQTYGFLS